MATHKTPGKKRVTSKAKRKIQPPIVEHHNGITVKDTGIFQTCSWTSKGNWVDELKKILQAASAENSLQNRQERLQRIASTSNTVVRAKATTALMRLEHFMSANPTEGERKSFLSGCMFGEEMMGAELRTNRNIRFSWEESTTLDEEGHSGSNRQVL